MRFMKRLTFLFINLVSFACLLDSCGPRSPQNKDVDLLKKLVIPNAYEVVVGRDNKLGLTSIAYKVRLKYPSMEVLEFCDKKHEGMGWQKSIWHTSDRGDRGWFKFIDGTTKAEPLVHQLSARWNNKDKTKMVDLLLKYYSYNLTEKEMLSAEKPNNDILTVIIQVGPYVEPPKSN